MSAIWHFDHLCYVRMSFLTSDREKIAQDWRVLHEETTAARGSGGTSAWYVPCSSGARRGVMKNQEVESWVADIAGFLKPAGIHWCDGSAQFGDRLPASLRLEHHALRDRLRASLS
jgi:hypothetical protein